MNPHVLYRSFTNSQKENFAEKAGTTLNYLTIKIFPANGYPVSIPRPDLMDNLLAQFKGEVSRDEMLGYFYPRFQRIA